MRNPEKSEEAAYLLNFLDLLETISSFYKQWGISYTDINELMGRQIFWYYSVFSATIEYRRNKYNDKSWYKPLEELANKFNT